jgi:hypothetical protein
MLLALGVLLICAEHTAAFRTTGIMAMTASASVDTSQFVGLAACPRLGLGLAAVGRPGINPKL